MANTAKARVLGAELRELRKQAGLTVRRLEERLSMSRSTISRIERGDKVPGAEDIGALLAIFSVTGDRRTELIEAAKEADQPNWVEIGGPGIPRQLSALLEFEREATRISDLSLVRVPGLLQTADYARAVFRAGGVPPEQVEMLVAIRMGRREVLTRPAPVRYLALIDEAVLRRPVGGSAVMADQLRHIVKMAELENVTVQVIPFEFGAHIGQDGSHLLLEFAKADPIVHLEHRRSGQFLDELKDTTEFLGLTANLSAQAMNAERSAEVIRSCADLLEG
ncbi:helix-turn-helix domain-containing protein [Saccharopolyspora mangrovi]|uniref:Helix-turn-helix transcriptional regulator n=1 Tax=Saccharopolyspora mangrovi TaxID=3082379 RepID=A0ABU6AI99_9PSEU|nr:helix-turn-helix transcriptional regulator [Saccharopolyspora sp. S2-29]MEB3371173.1 helix-turn-helix transcriptional regulator [Saccharopolyspora sp. S2-29]